jgi:hypothetical protein
MTFWYGSGSVDLNLCLTDPAPELLPSVSFEIATKITISVPVVYMGRYEVTLHYNEFIHKSTIT